MNSPFSILLKIKVHPLTWFIVSLAVITARFNELIMLMGMVLVHELGHAIAAERFKWRVNKIVLLPFGGQMETEEHGNQSSRQEAIVLLAGPLQHIWLFGLGVFLHANGILSEATFRFWISYNLVILLVNLLPIWPLDGGKLLFLLSSRYFSYRKAHAIMIGFSSLLLAFFILVILVFNPLNLNWWMIIAFLLFSLWVEWRQRKYVFLRFLLNRHYGHQPTLDRIIPLTVEREALVYTVLEDFWRNCKHVIIIKKDGKEVGKLDESEVLHACFSDKIPHRPVEDLLHSY